MLLGMIVSLVALDLVVNMDVDFPCESMKGMCRPRSTRAAAALPRAVLTVVLYTCLLTLLFQKLLRRTACMKGLQMRRYPASHM